MGPIIIAIFGSVQCALNARELIENALLMRRVLLKEPGDITEEYTEGDRHCRWCHCYVEKDEHHEDCEDDYAVTEPPPSWN